MIAMVVGEFQQHTKDEIQAAAQRASIQCIFVSEVTRAIAILRSLDSPPRCVFVSVRTDLAGLSEYLRESPDFYTIPVVGLVPFPSDEAYMMANRQGADDCIPEYDTGAVTRRLANLTDGEPPRLPEKQSGRALVAITDEEQRRHVGRRLRSAGYDVQFVSHEHTVEDWDEWESSEEPPSVLVSTPSLAPALETISERRANSTRLPKVTVPVSNHDPVSPRQLSNPEIGARLMFLVDEATRPPMDDVRASRRIQHSTLVTFRGQRSFEHTYGLTDNISRQGLYVRTLDPPPVGSDIRVNLRDKYGEVLQIRGTVAWRYAPSQVGGRMCPGFGMSIAEAACPKDDLEKFHALYADALSEIEAIESLEAPKPDSKPSGVQRTASAHSPARLEVG